MGSRAPRGLRFAVLSVLSIALSIGLSWWADSPEGSRRIADGIAAARGYDGCMCDDCTPRFLGVSIQGYGCMPTPFQWHQCDAGLAVLGASGVLLIAELLFSPLSRAIWRLTMRRSRTPACRKCGYDLRGLSPRSPCPECRSSRN